MSTRKQAQQEDAPRAQTTEEPPSVPDTAPEEAPQPPVSEGTDPDAQAKVAEAIGKLSDADKDALLAALGVPEAQRRVIARDRQTEREAVVSAGAVAGTNPVDADATKDMTAAQAASKADVDAERVIGYAVRARRNVDGGVMEDTRQLVVVLDDGSKVVAEAA